VAELYGFGGGVDAVARAEAVEMGEGPAGTAADVKDRAMSGSLFELAEDDVAAALEPPVPVLEFEEAFDEIRLHG
jgi:hypothetical protein